MDCCLSADQSSAHQCSNLLDQRHPQVRARLNGTYIDLNFLRISTKSTLCVGIICQKSLSQTRHLLITRPKLSPKMPSQEISFRMLTHIVTSTQSGETRGQCFDIQSQATFHSARTLRVNFSVKQKILFKRA